MVLWTLESGMARQGMPGGRARSSALKLPALFARRCRSLLSLQAISIMLRGNGIGSHQQPELGQTMRTPLRRRISTACLVAHSGYMSSNRMPQHTAMLKAVRESTGSTGTVICHISLTGIIDALSLSGLHISRHTGFSAGLALPLLVHLSLPSQSCTLILSDILIGDDGSHWLGTIIFARSHLMRLSWEPFGASCCLNGLSGR